MIILEYLPFSHDELPVQKRFEVAGANYNISIDYNWAADFYTFSILDDDDNPLFAGKVVYLEDVIDAVVDGLNLRVVPLVIEDVLKEIPEVERVSADNFDIVRLALL